MKTAEAKTNGRLTLEKKEEFAIMPLRQAVLTVPIYGVSPLKILRFSKKKQNQVMDTQKQGDQAKTKRKRAPKDFESEYEEAKYIGETKGKKWLGLNATGIRNGCIETCRMCGFVMTKAKMSIFCVADGYDIFDSTPLVEIEGTPEMVVDPVRNASGVIDLRARVMFREWNLRPQIRFDEDQFSVGDIINLMSRMGQQNGLGEGRPNSRDGNGTGNGLFEVSTEGIKLIRLKAPKIDVSLE